MLGDVAELRNIVIFIIGAERYALELRWVREVVSLGFVTDVPTAPAALGGVCNLHGAIVPVLDGGALLAGGSGDVPPRQGDPALVLETEGHVCALRVDQVEHVASLHAAAGEVIDGAGRRIQLLDASEMLRSAAELVAAAAERSA